MNSIRIYIVILITLQLHQCLSQQNSNATYEWQPEPWSGCAYRDARACCDCYRKRNVHCVLRDSGRRIAPFYCRKLAELQPPESEMCSSCQQDCVFSTWSEWSSCSETCTPSTRFRTRHVLLLPSDGGKECGALLDIANCAGLLQCDVTSPQPKYDWFIGDWTSCRKVCWSCLLLCQ